MEKCYIINAPWVFYALWKGVTPLVSVNTAGKVQVRAEIYRSGEDLTLAQPPTIYPVGSQNHCRTECKDRIVLMLVPKRTLHPVQSGTRYIGYSSLGRRFRFLRKGGGVVSRQDLFGCLVV